MKIQFGKWNKKYYPLLIVLMALLLVMSVIGGVFAKYIEEYNKDGEVGAAEFYFESDLLKEGGVTYTLNAGTKEISFVLKNHADALRFSETDITYTITLEGGGSLDKPTDTLTKGAVDSEKITLSGMTDGETYTVTATGVGGYKKTLSATFTVRTEPTGFYKHVDDSNAEYVLLTVWTAKTSGEATITIPQGLIPDRTDPELEEVDTSFEKTFNEYESRVYRFFKTKNYQINFSVKINGEEALESVPA